MNNIIDLRRAIICVFLVILFCATILDIPVIAANLGELQLGVTVNGSITQDNTSDEWSVSLSNPGILEITITAVGDFEVELLNSSGTKMNPSEYTTSGEYSKSFELDGDNYVVRINNVLASTGTYELKVEFTASTTPPPTEPPDTTSQPSTSPVAPAPSPAPPTDPLGRSGMFLLPILLAVGLIMSLLGVFLIRRSKL